MARQGKSRRRTCYKAGNGKEQTTRHSCFSSHGRTWRARSLFRDRSELHFAVKAFDQHLGGAIKGNLDAVAAARLASAAVGAGAALERASGPQLDHLLAARIDRLNSAAHRVELIALVAILLLAYLFAGFYASVGSAVRKMLERLRGLDAHDLTDLSTGLQAIAAGDLTVDARPSTEPIENPGRDELGDMTRISFQD